MWVVSLRDWLVYLQTKSPLYTKHRRFDGPKNQFGHSEKNSATAGTENLISQLSSPLPSDYNDWAILGPCIGLYCCKLSLRHMPHCRHREDYCLLDCHAKRSTVTSQKTVILHSQHCKNLKFQWQWELLMLVTGRCSVTSHATCGCTALGDRKDVLYLMTLPVVKII